MKKHTTGMTVGDVLASKTKKAPPQRFWMGDVAATDDFDRSITTEFIDGRTAAGPWATMNPASWRMFGIGRLGTGFGQRYQKQDDGRWLKVEG